MVKQCYKIKDGKSTKIPINQCKSKFLKKLLGMGYTVSVVKEVGNKTEIDTFSPKTREEALKEHKKRFGKLPF